MTINEAISQMPTRSESSIEFGSSAGKRIPSVPQKGAIHPELPGFLFLSNGKLISYITGRPAQLTEELLDNRWELLPMGTLTQIVATPHNPWKYLAKAIMWGIVSIGFFSLAIYLWESTIF